MLQLIDRNKLEEVEIEGSKFFIKPMTNGERIILASRLKALDQDDSAYDELMTMASKYIDHVEGVEDSKNILVNVKSYAVQLTIIKKILATNELDEAAAKNSLSLSDSQPTEN